MAKRDNHWRRTCIVRLWVRILLLIKVKKLAAKSHQRDENFIQWYCPKIDGPQRVSRGDDGGGLPFSDWADPIKVVWESPICRWIRTSVTRFGKKLQVFGKFLSVYFIFDKMLSLLWQICDILGLIFNFANGQILKNNLTIWSHCSWYAWRNKRRVRIGIKGLTDKDEEDSSKKTKTNKYPRGRKESQTRWKKNTERIE